MYKSFNKLTERTLTHQITVLIHVELTQMLQFMEISNVSRINLITVKKELNTNNADISKLVSECMGDKEYLNEIVILLNENIEEFYDTTEVCIKAKDRFSISRGAHKIKNGLEMVQAPVLLHYVDLIQKECQHLDTFKNIQTILNQFKTEYKLVQSSLYSQIDQLDE